MKQQSARCECRVVENVGILRFAVDKVFDHLFTGLAQCFSGRVQQLGMPTSSYTLAIKAILRLNPGARVIHVPSGKAPIISLCACCSIMRMSCFGTDQASSPLAQFFHPVDPGFKSSQGSTGSSCATLSVLIPSKVFPPPYMGY